KEILSDEKYHQLLLIPYDEFKEVCNGEFSTVYHVERSCNLFIKSKFTTSNYDEFINK
ncbi:26998_t:CDS:1, partial [Racocetra persica]